MYENPFVFSVDSSTDKPKQFRWNFHKKAKNSTSNSSHNNVNNTKNVAEATSITEEGILRLNELIDFLSKPESEYQCTLVYLIKRVCKSPSHHTIYIEVLANQQIQK